MEWTKIPTTLITKRYSDQELLSIVKFQLVWAVIEEHPDESTCLRYMTKKQFEIAQEYIESIAEGVGDDVRQVKRKREADKKRYSKNKHLEKIPQAERVRNEDGPPNQIRLDKNRDNNIYNNIPEKIVEIEEGKFFMDDTIPEYKELLSGLSDDEVEKLWRWIMKKYEYQKLPVSKIQSMIINFKNKKEA